MTSYNEIGTLVQRIKDLEERMATAEGAPRLSYSSIKNGGITEYDEDGNIVARYGQQWDGTHTSASLGGPTPPQPSDPVLYSGPMSLTVSWGGGYAYPGDVAPMDFARVEIHVSPTPVFAATPSTLAGTFESAQGGQQGILFQSPGTYYVKLATRSQSGKLSPPSNEVMGTPEEIAATPAPAAPINLQVVPTWHYSQTFVPRARFSLSWDPVAASDDSVPVTVVAYDIWFRTSTETDQDWILLTSSGSSSVVVDNLNLDVTYLFKVCALTDTTKSDFSSAVSSTYASASVVEASITAATPQISSKLAVASISHSGLSSTGAALPPQVAKTEIEIKKNAGAFTYLTSFFGPGSTVADQVAVGDVVSVRARTVLYSGKLGTWSATASATIVGIVDSDLVSTTVDESFSELGAAITSVTVSSSGKTTNIYSTEVASGSGVSAGDTWNRVDDSDRVIAQWRWSGSAWVSQTLENAMFANIDAGKISSGFIASARIDAGSITAGKLLVGETQNLIANGAGELGSIKGWPSTLTWDPTDKPATLPGSFRSVPSAATLPASSAVWAVIPGAEYSTEIWIKANKPNSVIYIELRDQTGAHGASNITAPGSPDTGAAQYLLGAVVVPTVWTKYTTISTIAAGATSLRVGGIFLNHASGTEITAQVWLAGLRMRPRNTGELIVDGSITTTKLDALSITSDKLAANSVIAGKILAGSIDGMIITGAILRTAASGQRVHIDTTGLKGYNNLDQVVTSISATNGALTAVGGTFSGTITATGGSITGNLTLTGSINVPIPVGATVGTAGFTLTSYDGLRFYRREFDDATPVDRLTASFGSYVAFSSARVTAPAEMTGDYTLLGRDPAPYQLSLGSALSGQYASTISSKGIQRYYSGSSWPDDGVDYSNVDNYDLQLNRSGGKVVVGGEWSFETTTSITELDFVTKRRDRSTAVTNAEWNAIISKTASAAGGGTVGFPLRIQASLVDMPGAVNVGSLKTSSLELVGFTGPVNPGDLVNKTYSDSGGPRARGVLGYASRTTSVGSIANTKVEILATGSTPFVRTFPGRMYKISFRGSTSSVTATDVVVVTIERFLYLGGGSYVQIAQFPNHANSVSANIGKTHSGFVIMEGTDTIDPGNGDQYGFKVFIARSGSGGAVTAAASSNDPWQMVVEDIGAVVS